MRPSHLQGENPDVRRTEAAAGPLPEVGEPGGFGQEAAASAGFDLERAAAHWSKACGRVLMLASRAASAAMTSCHHRRDWRSSGVSTRSGPIR
jgi:hypothetical protein